MTLNGTAWAPIGPSPIDAGGNPDNGMVSSIAINPNNPNVIYIGTAGGGVWRSRNGGTAWTPLFDRELALGIGEPAAIAIDPNNTDVVYAGTSERVVLGTGNSGFFGSPDSSQGLYKSTDAGNSWVQLGSGFPAGNVGSATKFVGLNINVVIVDPADSNTLYLGCSRGVFFSGDGGLNWTQGSGAAGDARSLVLDTSTPVGSRVLYTGLTGQGVFKSTNGGQSWTQILSGSTAVVASAVGASPKAFSKVIVAIAPPASPPNAAGVQVLYVSLSGSGGAPDPVGVFQSTDQGGTWTQRTASGMPTGTQGGYSFHMAIDPASPGDGVNDIIYFGVVGQAKSTDSGSSFSSLSIPHADTHAWAFVPRPTLPSIVFCGNDGGIDRSDNGGSSWTALGGGGLQTALVFNIDIKPDATASEVVCALQDNGLLTTAGVASPEWSTGQGGDGFDIAYDGVTAGRVYGTSGFWSPAPCTRVFFSTGDGTDSLPLGPGDHALRHDQRPGVRNLSDHDRPEQRRSRVRQRPSEPMADPRWWVHVEEARWLLGRRQRRRGGSRRQQRRDRGGRPGVRDHQRARHQRRHVHQHHPQPPRTQRSPCALRPDRPDRHLRGAWRVQRFRHAGAHLPDHSRWHRMDRHHSHRRLASRAAGPAVQRHRVRRHRGPDHDLCRDRPWCTSLGGPGGLMEHPRRHPLPASAGHRPGLQPDRGRSVRGHVWARCVQVHQTRRPVDRSRASG